MRILRSTPEIYIPGLDAPLYLTGSHFFGTASAVSDIDFFTQNSLVARTALTCAKFKIHLAVPYNDRMVTVVYRKGKIDIQLVVSAEIKSMAQGLLLDLMVFKPTTEQWNAAYRYVETYRYETEFS